MCNMFKDYNLGARFQYLNPGDHREIFGIVFEEISELQARQSRTNRFVMESMNRYGSLCHFLPRFD